MRILHTYRYSYWFLICLGLCLIQANSVWGQLHCLNYTSQDGLPSDDITCATEDLDGFMWFGSSNGICKFDGFSFDSYSYLDADNSPGGNLITAIEIDNNNDLWVGTQDAGLFHLNRKENVWEHFATGKSGYYQLKGNEIFFIHVDQSGIIWYGSDRGGLGSINPVVRFHENLRLDTLPRRDTWVNRTYDLTEDLYDPNIIHLVGQGYLYRYNKVTRRFSTPEIKVGPNAHEDYVFNPQSIVQTAANEFLIGSLDAGVKSYNQKTGIYQDVFPREVDDILSWKNNVFKGGEGEFWIVDRTEGIALMYYNSNKLELFRPEPFYRQGLLKGSYNSIYQSSLDHTWVMTSKGVSLIVPQYQAFQYFETKVDGPNMFLDIDTIPNSDFFFGSFGGMHAGLKILDKDLTAVFSYQLKKPSEVFTLMLKSEFFKGEYLCLTDQLYSFDLASKTLSLKRIAGLPDSVQVGDFLIREEHELWLLLSNGNLLKYDDTKQKSHLYPFSGYDNVADRKVIYHGMSMVGSKIWVATHEELIVFDPLDGQSSYLYFDKNSLKQRNIKDGIKGPGGSIKQVIPIDQNCAWVMTGEDGLYKICASANDSFVIHEHRDEGDLSQLLGPIEMINGTSDDYWLATKNGLVHANSNLDEFRVFNQSEGLKTSILNTGLTRIDDELYIGLPKGFARVNVNDLLKENKDARIKIVKATIGGIVLDEKKEGRFSHQQNNLVVSVAAPNFHEARQVEIAHRLINHSDEWEHSGPNEKTFRYNKLPPGDYVFEVKGRSPTTNWSLVESKQFTITAPFWKRGWFHLLIGVCILALVFTFYQWILARKLKQEKIKTEIAELEGRALRAQMNPHFIFNSLNSIKSLVLLDRKKEGVTYLTKFSRMVREILSLTKEKQIPLQKELELLGMYLDMEDLRFQGKFEYEINVSSELNTHSFMVPPLLIQPFVENSIWHGLLHKEGDAKLEIDIYQTNENLYITIKDNGIGRKAATQLKFKKDLYNKTSEGLKLSLNRMKLISELAEISIEDLYEGDKPSGTLVTLKLPIDHE